MGSTNKTTYFFKNKPLFGFDIGSGSLKVMQLDPDTLAHDKPKVIGYGSTKFDRSAVDNGVIVKPELIAEATMELFQRHLCEEPRLWAAEIPYDQCDLLFLLLAAR